MAYNAVSQNDRDPAFDSDGSDASPLPKSSFAPLSIDFDNLGGSMYMDAAKPEKPSSISLKSVIRSGAASVTSYDMLEDDDYHAVEPNSKQGPDCHVKDLPSAAESRPTPLSLSIKPPSRASPDPPEPILHSPITEGPALCHPTPDLQSLQGAYVGNVERLEQSAARLSLALEATERVEKVELSCKEAPLGSPIGSLKSRSRNQSVGSQTGPTRSIRSGVCLPTGHASSPKKSLQSSPASQSAALRSGSIASRLTKVVEPQDEFQPSHSEPMSSTLPIIAPPPNPHTPPQGPLQFEEGTMGVPIDDALQAERPGSAGSTDTYRQATNLFKDFDGVHFTPHNEQLHTRQVSLNRPPLASLPQAHDEPAPGENMVYYPAPVPMVLNLPQRLSKKTIAMEQEKRRTQVIGSIPVDKRKSAVWLTPNEKEPDAVPREQKRASNLPPQLRASAFFDQAPTQLDITVKENSAVATLDSILDAAASAPVSAFTDHPIVGHIGAEVYGKEKRKKKNKIEKKRPISEEPPQNGDGTERPVSHVEEHAGPDEATPFKNSYEHDPDRSERGSQHPEQDKGSPESDGEDEESEEEAFIGQPTTLLAELQMRKQEQRQRNRTAATAFPNGMHSTLLELDAVAQRQKHNRNRGHVTLAWEDPDLAGRREPDDDDVPLALLFPDKSKKDDNRPLGLMEKLELDENEPLSRRRARIRGEPPPAPRSQSAMFAQPPANRASTAYTLNVPGLDDGNESDEGETLAQRARRMKAQEDKRVSSDFASELLSKFGDEKPPEKPPSNDGEPEEETLGQRRKRLQAEAQAGVTSTNVYKTTAKRTMADVLQAHPVGMQPPNGLYPPGTDVAANRQSMLSVNRLSNGPLLSFGKGVDPYNSQGLISPAYGNGLSAVNLNPHYYAQLNRPGLRADPDPAIDQRQRDVIDRWRLGIQ